MVITSTSQGLPKDMDWMAQCVLSPAQHQEQHVPVSLDHTWMSQLTLACVIVTNAKVLSPYFVLGFGVGL